MKKILYLFSLFLIFTLFSCASTSVSEDINNYAPAEVSTVSKNTKNSKYDDWKYKGFGGTIPGWFEPALEKNKANVIKHLSDLKSQDFNIFVSTGFNVDQAEAKIRDENELEGWKLYQDFWVRKFGKTEGYTIAMIYIKTDLNDASESENKLPDEL